MLGKAAAGWQPPPRHRGPRGDDHAEPVQDTSTRGRYELGVGQGAQSDQVPARTRRSRNGKGWEHREGNSSPPGDARHHPVIDSIRRIGR